MRVITKHFGALHDVAHHALRMFSHFTEFSSSCNRLSSHPCLLPFDQTQVPTAQRQTRVVRVQASQQQPAAAAPKDVPALQRRHALGLLAATGIFFGEGGDTVFNVLQQLLMHE